MKVFYYTICLRFKNITFVNLIVIAMLMVGTKINAAKSFSALLVLFFFFSFQGNAATWYSNNAATNTNANLNTNWSGDRFGGSGNPSTLLNTADTFIIQSGHQYQLTATWAGNVSGIIQVETGGAIDLNAKTITALLRFDIAGTGVSSSGAFFTSNGTLTMAKPIALTAAATIKSAGAGTLTLSGVMTYAGNTLTITGAQATTISGTSSLTAATTIISSGTGLLTISGAITNSTFTLTIDGASATTLSSVIGAGTGGLTKNGAGTLTLSGANTYTGATTINNGTLKISAAAKIPDASALVVTSPGIFDLNGVAETVGSIAGTGTITSSAVAACTLTSANTSNTTFSGIIQNGSSTAVSLTKTGTGTLTLSGTNTFTGNVTVSGGTLSVSTDLNLGAIKGSVTTAAITLNGGTLKTTTSFTLTTFRGITLGASGGTIETNTSTTLTYGGVIGGGANALTKTGSGILLLGGTSTYTGLTTVSAGTLQYGVTNALSSGAVTVNGGTLALLTFSDTVGTVTLSGGGVISSTTGVLTGTSYAMQDGTVSAILAGAVALTKTTAGTVTLSGTNTYTGVTSINAGTLSVATIGNGGVAGNLGAATNTAANLVLGGGTLQYTGATASTNRNYTLTAATTSSIEITNAASALTYTGIITSSGALTKIGTGTLILQGNNTYTGATTITAGELRFNPSTTSATFASSQIILNGGTLSTTGITANTIITSSSTLKLNDNSTIALGTGIHSFKFAASNGVAWTAAKTLTITGWTGIAGVSGTSGKLFSGSVIGGLTVPQTGQISFTGYTGTAVMLSTGEFVPYIACVAPTAQPTSLVFSAVNGTVLSGSFTAASPAPSKYLVVRSTSATAPSPSPSNGTTYVATNTVGGGTVIQASAALSFSDTGLTKGTTYYYYIYAYNDNCSGTSPAYLTTSPLSGYVTTSTKNTWYINNTLDANDVYTTAAGSGSNDGLSPSTPFDNLNTLYTSYAAANDVIYVDSGTYTLGAIRNIAFTKAITIIGAGSYLTIFNDASHVSYFGVITASDVKISNIKFYQYGNDSASLKEGVTISIEAGASNLTGIEIKGCWFDNNAGSAQNGALSITTSGGKVTANVSNTIFSCTNNGLYGGACTIEGNGHTIGFTKCFFYKNERFAPGGGIWIKGTNSYLANSTVVNVSDCTFNANEGTRGGAICVDVARLNVTNSCFTLNTNSDSANTGNAIFGSRYAIVSITNSKFTSNTYGKAQVSINTSTNTSGWDGPSTDLTITTSDFDASAVSPQAIYFAGTTASVTESTFNGSATTQIQNASGTFTLSNSGNPAKSGTFSGNTSARSAAATSAVCMMPISGACGSLVVSCTTSDIFAPVINETYSIIATDGVCNYIVPTFTATDVCDGSPTVTQSPAAGTILIAGTITPVTITATDASGNSSTATVNVTTPSCPGPCPTQTTWDGSDWSNNAPTTSVRVILNGNYNSSTNGNIDACNLIIKSGVTLTIPDNTYVNVVNSITNNGVNNIAIATKGSLIQVNSGASGNAISGGAIDVPNITITKTTTNKIKFDYVYWSKPLATASLVKANFDIAPTTAFDLKYYWDPDKCGNTIAQDYLGWRTLTLEPVVGTGFITRVKTAAGLTPATITVAFSGTSNNGDISAGVKYYDTNDQAYRNYTLLGNPYPGAINFQDFYTDNADKIYGTVYLWSSNTPYPGIGFYREADYASYNLTGGVGVGLATIQSPNGMTPYGYIASGQGFMVRPKVNGTVTFKNSQRTKTIPSNDQFFKNAAPIEKDRYWLRISDSNRRTNQQLIGYVPEATEGFDDAYDGVISSSSSLQFYSILENQNLVIQGKGTFNVNDTITLGYSKTNAVSNQLTISIENKEGIFSSQQNIYVHDKELNSYANISKRPYEFIGTTNTNNRFEIVYQLPHVAPEPEIDLDTILISVSEESLTIFAPEPIVSVVLYDITGKLVFQKTTTRMFTTLSTPISLSSGVYIAQVVLENKTTYTKKIIKM